MNNYFFGIPCAGGNDDLTAYPVVREKQRILTILRCRKGRAMRRINMYVTAFIVVASLLITMAAIISACMADRPAPDIIPDAGNGSAAIESPPAAGNGIPDTDDNEPPPVQTPPVQTSPSQISAPTLSPNPGPVDNNVIEGFISQYMQLIEVGDTTELARWLLIDGGVTDSYIAIAQRVIEHFTIYDISDVSVIGIDYNATVQQYSILVRDGQDAEFTVLAMYGDGLLGIDVSMY
jgi:hypothetical protein